MTTVGCHPESRFQRDEGSRLARETHRDPSPFGLRMTVWDGILRGACAEQERSAQDDYFVVTLWSN